MSKKDLPADGGAAELRSEPQAPTPPAEPKSEDAKASETKAPDDGRRTPEEWATEFGHVDKKVREGARRPITEAKGYIFAAVKAHCGWGRQRAIDERLTRAEYEEAVSEALGMTIGGGVKPPPMKWRHDVRDARKEAGK